MNKLRRYSSCITSFYTVYLFSFLIYIQFPYSHNIAADVKESIGYEEFKICHDGDDKIDENVVHFHSYSKPDQTYCPLCTLVSSHYIDGFGCIFSFALVENDTSGFLWNTSYHSKTEYQFPDLRAPPSL